MKLLRKIDVILLIIISIAAIVIAVIHTLDLFSLAHLLAEINYSLICLVFLGLIGIHLALSFIIAEDNQHESLKKFDELITSSDNIKIKKFEDSFELETYLAKRVHEAKYEVCDLTWKLTISSGFAVGKRKDSHSVYEKAVKEFSDKLIYREVWIFNDSRRIEKFNKRMKENKNGYSCRYYKAEKDEINKIPRLQFVIIDQNEVIFFASATNSLLCSIKGEAVYKICKPYFDEVWSNAIPIKEGKTIYQNEIDYINETYSVKS
jgi:hypothetical protein